MFQFTHNILDFITKKRAETEVHKLLKRELLFFASANIVDIKYELGYWFAEAAMATLTIQGMPTSEALTKLIQTPPKTLTQFQHPANYTKRLINSL